MPVCSHCGLENNNKYFCKGCGHEILEKTVCVPVLPETNINFLDEVIDTLEETFPPVSEKQADFVTQTPSMKIDDFISSEGTVMVENSYMLPISKKESFFAVFSENVMIMLFSVLFATAVKFIFPANLILLTKVYFLSFALIGFLSWVVFPFLVGAPPLSMTFKRFFIIKGVTETIKGDLTTSLLLWLTSFLFYSSLFGIFLEIIVFFSKGQKSESAMFYVTSVKYMKRKE